MKNISLVFIIIFSLSGCAIAPKADAIRKVADQNVFKNIDKDTKFSISLPSPHSGPYSSVDQLNFKIEEGKYKGVNASAFVGKSRKTEEWEVLVVMIEENGEWINLLKIEGNQ